MKVKVFVTAIYLFLILLSIFVLIFNKDEKNDKSDLIEEFEKPAWQYVNSKMIKIAFALILLVSVIQLIKVWIFH